MNSPSVSLYCGTICLDVFVCVHVSRTLLGGPSHEYFVCLWVRILMSTLTLDKTFST